MIVDVDHRRADSTTIVVFFDSSVTTGGPHGSDKSEVMERRLHGRAIVLLIGVERQKLHLDI